ncbi:PAAR domain-containing protein [Cupriavidus sp. 2KB_3]|uniref:PAAR domain-containing protein n=1 Tax=Cupriavidus TaxID=106589 RepID=UPI0011EFC5D9|nr:MULTISPECIES: PAAR domain-containing protein [Cupriavidus]
MRGAIRLHDRTDQDGYVESASGEIVIDGRPVALVGDVVNCSLPSHGKSAILPGASQIYCGNRQVALHGFIAGCGCRLLSSTTGFGE